MATAPLALHETAMELIQAGFHPSQCKILQVKIKCMVQQTITSSVEKYRIPIKESIGGFVVPGKFLIPCLGRTLTHIPDPSGLLEEGQIYYRSSQPMTDPKTEMDYFVLQGEVVVCPLLANFLAKLIFFVSSGGTLYTVVTVSRN
jgi:hypothetical protein